MANEAYVAERVAEVAKNPKAILLGAIGAMSSTPTGSANVAEELGLSKEEIQGARWTALFKKGKTNLGFLKGLLEIIDKKEEEMTTEKVTRILEMVKDLSSSEREELVKALAVSKKSGLLARWKKHREEKKLQYVKKWELEGDSYRNAGRFGYALWAYEKARNQEKIASLIPKFIAEGSFERLADACKALGRRPSNEELLQLIKKSVKRPLKIEGIVSSCCPEDYCPTLKALRTLLRQNGNVSHEELIEIGNWAVVQLKEAECLGDIHAAAEIAFSAFVATKDREVISSFADVLSGTYASVVHSEGGADSNSFIKPLRKKCLRLVATF